MPSVCFQCVDTLLFASKHTKGMTLRHDGFTDLTRPLHLVGTWYFSSAHNCNTNWVSTICRGRQVSHPNHAKSFWEVWCGFLPRNHFIIRFFRRATANGFYPWGNVDSPRERVAEGLCGWWHGNSFPMTQSAQSHRQMRSIPLCSKAVFLCFCFWFHSQFGNIA